MEFLIYYVTKLAVPASVGDYQRTNNGPKFTVNVASVVNSATYANSNYYSNNLQNIYAKNYKNGGLGNRRNCNTDGCPTAACDLTDTYDIAEERRAYSHYQEPNSVDQTCPMSDHTVCTVIESSTVKEENVGYTFDQKQRLQWELNNNEVHLPLLNEAIDDPDNLMLDLATVVKNFFDNFGCPAEIGVEIDQTCPAQPTLNAVTLNPDICVKNFQQPTVTKCSTGFLRASLVQDVSGLDNGVTVRLYWHFAVGATPGFWGKPYADNYDPADWDVVGQQPTTDYETRYDAFNPNDLTGTDMLKLLCRCELPVSTNSV